MLATTDARARSTKTAEAQVIPSCRSLLHQWELCASCAPSLRTQCKSHQKEKLGVDVEKKMKLKTKRRSKDAKPKSQAEAPKPPSPSEEEGAQSLQLSPRALHTMPTLTLLPPKQQKTEPISETPLGGVFSFFFREHTPHWAHHGRFLFILAMATNECVVFLIYPRDG